MACIKVITDVNNSNIYKARGLFDKRSGPGVWLAGGSIPFVWIYSLVIVFISVHEIATLKK